MAAEFLLRKKNLAVDDQFERAACTGYERERLDDMLVVTQNIGRRTDGPFCVVSGNAVFERDDVVLLHSSVSRLGNVFVAPDIEVFRQQGWK